MFYFISAPHTCTPSNNILENCRETVLINLMVFTFKTILNHFNFTSHLPEASLWIGSDSFWVSLNGKEGSLFCPINRRKVSCHLDDATLITLWTKRIWLKIARKDLEGTIWSIRYVYCLVADKSMSSLGYKMPMIVWRRSSSQDGRDQRGYRRGQTATTTTCPHLRQTRLPPPPSAVVCCQPHQNNRALK